MRKKIILFLCCAVALISCNRNKQEQEYTIKNTTTSGVITICVDETLKPIIEQQIEVFEGLYPKANIIPIYTSEVEYPKLPSTGWPSSATAAIPTHW